MLRSALSGGGSMIAAIVLTMFGLPSSVLGFSTDPEEVDPTTVYRFGDYEVSQYLLDKNYNLWRESKTRESGRSPSGEETRDWFALFVARQALISELRREGYDRKSEVEQVVLSMESYMLSSEDGPLYELLLRRRNSKAPDFREELKNSRTLFEGVVVRLTEGESQTEDFVSELGLLSDAEKLSRLEEAVRGNVMEGWDGELVWPYNPYLDARNLLATCSPGVVHGPVYSDLGVYYYYKRGQVERDAAMLSGDEIQSVRLLDKINRDIFIESRRGRILGSAKVRIDQESAVSLINSFPQDTSRIPEIDLASLSVDPDSRLLVYDVGEDEGAGEISVSEFCDYYNSRMMRSVLGGMEDLEALLYDCVLSDFNRREAERLGVLDDPRFVENRKNFENGQLLSFYIERDLAELVSVSNEEVEERYETRKDRFFRPDVIEGALAVFPSQKEALESVSGVVDSNAKVSTIVVRADAASNPFPLPLDALMTLPEGQPLGPFAYGDGYAMFRKVKELSRSALPLEKVESGIRRDLIQRKADDFIKSRFASRIAESGFQELLDYSRYGIDSPLASLAKEDKSQNAPLDAAL